MDRFIVLVRSPLVVIGLMDNGDGLLLRPSNMTVNKIEQFLYRKKRSVLLRPKDEKKHAIVSHLYFFLRKTMSKSSLNSSGRDL